MENITNQVIVLGSGKKFFILRQALYKGVTYYFAAELTDDEEDFTNNFVFLERKESEDGAGVRPVKDKTIVDVLAKNIKIEE